MDNTLSKAELKTLHNFMRTDLGKKVLGGIADLKQDYLDAAVAGYRQGKDYTHDNVVAAAAIETVYQFLKPPKSTEEKTANED